MRRTRTAPPVPAVPAPRGAPSQEIVPGAGAAVSAAGTQPVLPAAPPAVQLAGPPAGPPVGVPDRRRPQHATVIARLMGDQGPQQLSEAATSIVRGKRVLVTGAGGSIGSELVRQLAGMGADALYLLDRDESLLHALHLELTGSGLLDDDQLVLADIRDRQRMLSLFAEVKPQIVFHAAAHKHLPMLERFPCEGVKTNVLGTQHLVDAALEHDVERFILISTDKAAAPTSALGRTKRLAELIVQQATAAGTTRFASVRFGNVIGSRGSFLDSVRWQLEHGLPVTMTDPDVTRFMMTIPEAVALVLEASALAEQGETYVLDMGEPVRIVDLVREYAQVARYPDVQLEFSGLRPGEKLHEVLQDVSEESEPTAHPRVSVMHPGPGNPQLRGELAPLYAAALNADTERCGRLLAAALTTAPEPSSCSVPPAPTGSPDGTRS